MAESRAKCLHAPNALYRLLILSGIIAGLQISRLFPAPPVFSDWLGRATYYQSYENNYFASLRSFDEHISRVVKSGRTPVIVLGDSTMRGTGAGGPNVWTVQLQQRLAASNSSLTVINFAQNAGDLLAPYLFYHFYEKYPTAIFVWGWHHTNVSMLRHPFHFWLTSEIILRDGRDNPAVAIGLDETPINTTSPSEWGSLVLAGLNIITPYLDVGNHLRYWAFGNIAISAKRNPTLIPLSEDSYEEPDVFLFSPRPDLDYNASMSKIYYGFEEALKGFVERPSSKIQQYFDQEFSHKYRGRLLVAMIDLNPYFANQSSGAKTERSKNWQSLRKRMAEVPGLNWTSLIADEGDLSAEDFVDLGHLNVAGQAKLADQVSAALTRMPTFQGKLQMGPQ